MYRFFDLFRRTARPKTRRAAARRLGIESLEGRAVPASLAAPGQDAGYAMTDHADAGRIVLTDVLISNYESKPSASSKVSMNDIHFVHKADKPSASSKVTMNDFHFVKRSDTASPALFLSVLPEGADTTMSTQSPNTDAVAR